MDQTRFKQLYEQFDLRETEDLVNIWKEHNSLEWMDEVFEVIGQILLTRLGELPPFDDNRKADLHLEQAQKFVWADDYENALNEMDLAIQAAPNAAEIYQQKGNILDEMGRLDEASACFQKALLLDAKSTEAKKSLKKIRDAMPHQKIPSEYRIFAAISHVSVIIETYGALIPALVWIFNHKKSTYVAFQSLQALVLQTLSFLILLFQAILIAGLAIFLPMSNQLNNAAEVPTIIARSISILSVTRLCSQGLIGILGIIAAICSILGKNFRYPIIANLIDKFTVDKKVI